MLSTAHHIAYTSYSNCASSSRLSQILEHSPGRVEQNLVYIIVSHTDSVHACAERRSEGHPQRAEG
eukprot:6209609-Pleurochrysis_carterae.AAC.1